MALDGIGDPRRVSIDLCDDGMPADSAAPLIVGRLFRAQNNDTYDRLFVGGRVQPRHWTARVAIARVFHASIGSRPANTVDMPLIKERLATVVLAAVAGILVRVDRVHLRR